MGDINNNVGFPDTEPLVCDYPGSLAVPPLELMFLSDGSISSVATGKCAPVTSLTDTGSKATNQQHLSGAFLGLAGSRKAATDGSGTMTVHRKAIRQMTCNALLSAAKVGDMVAGSVLTATGGTALTSFIVEVTTDASKKIGYVIQAAAAGSTTLKVYFQSNVVSETLGGSQAINTAANLTLTGNLSVGGNSAITGSEAVTGDISATNAVFTGNATSSGFVSSKAAALAATGTVIGNAAAIIAQANAVTGATNTGVQLPTIASGKVKPIFVRSDPSNAILVYPAVNCTIDGGSANAAVSLAAGEKRVFFSDGASNHMSIKSA
jgi:hypothetical protein